MRVSITQYLGGTTHIIIDIAEELHASARTETVSMSIQRDCCSQVLTAQFANTNRTAASARAYRRSYTET